MSIKYFEEKTRTGVSTKKFNSDFGSKILEKFGWKEGEGLGKNKTGIKETIQIKRREENIGLGKKKMKEKWNDNWWENSYNNVLKNIKGEKNKKIEENSDDENENENEEKLKRSRKNSERKKSFNSNNSNSNRKISLNSRKNSINSINSQKKNNMKKKEKIKSKREIIYIDKKKKITMIEI